LTQRDPRLALEQMLATCRRIVLVSEDRRRADLDSDELLDLAIVRLLEVLGEAARRVPAEEQTLMPQIPWAAVISLRNRLIHGYDSVDLDIVWQVVREGRSRSPMPA
jgi:uncharacterized protein with HEPN domain